MVRQHRYAGFWIRVCADFVDSLLLDFAACLAGLILLGAVYWVKIIFFKEVDGTHVPFLEVLPSFLLQVFLAIARCVLSLIYYTWGAYRYGTSIGKRLFGVYIVSAKDGTFPTFRQSLVRCLGYLVSYLVFATGFLMIAFHPRKQGLHDLLAGTICVYRKKGQGAEEAKVAPAVPGASTEETEKSVEEVKE